MPIHYRIGTNHSGSSVVRDYLEIIGSLLLVGFIALLIHTFDVGPQKVAYEVGQTLKELRTGFTDGGGAGFQHLNDMFQEKAN